MKKLTIGILIILMFFMAMRISGLSNAFFLHSVEWITKFVFPWVALNWLIRLVKAIEKNEEGK